MITLRPLTVDDLEFVFSCLLMLRGQAEYSVADLQSYCERWQLMGPSSPILIALYHGEPVGMLTCNRFVIPRYLGFGIELEEVIISQEFQGQGLAGQIIDIYLGWVAQQPEIRRVQVRTDDASRAGRVYARRFSKVPTSVFTHTVHRL